MLQGIKTRGRGGNERKRFENEDKEGGIGTMRRFEIESEGRERGEGERIIRRGENNKEKRRARR